VSQSHPQGWEEMQKIKTFLRSGTRHWWVWMGIALYLISLVTAVTPHVISRWVYWLAALVCVLIGCYKTWSDEYDRAETYKTEAAELYAQVILDWFKMRSSSTVPASFPSTFVADEMRLDHDKVVRGLTILEQWKFMRNDGVLGWAYDATAGFRVDSQFRRIISN
jgi:hypothetical protein